MPSIKKTALAAGLVAAGVALAHSFGLWLCDECRIGAVGTADAGGAVADSVIFIKLQNAAIHATAKERRIARWIAGDIITICDGEHCLILVYQAGGSWIPPGGSYPDPKTGYANVQRTGMSRAHSTARFRVAAPAALAAIGGGAVIVAPPSVAPGIEPSLTGTVTVGMPTIVDGVILDWGSFGGSFSGSFYSPIYSGGANDGSRGIADGP